MYTLEKLRTTSPNNSNEINLNDYISTRFTDKSRLLSFDQIRAYEKFRNK